MEREGLKQDILNKIKSDPMLYGKIAAELRLSPTTLPKLIYDRDNRLTQRGVLRILSEHLNVGNSEDLLEMILETENNINTSVSQLQETL